MNYKIWYSKFKISLVFTLLFSSNALLARGFSVCDYGKPINFLSSATRFYLRFQQANKMSRAKNDADLGRKRRALSEIKKEILVCEGCNIFGDFLNNKCDTFSFDFSGNYGKALRLATSKESSDAKILKNRNLWHLLAFGEFVFSNANIFKLKQFKTVESQAYLASLGKLLCELGLDFCQKGKISGDDKYFYFVEAFSRSAGTVFAFVDAENKILNQNCENSGNSDDSGSGTVDDDENGGEAAKLRMINETKEKLPVHLKKLVKFGYCIICTEDDQIIFDCPHDSQHSLGCINCIKKAKDATYETEFEGNILISDAGKKRNCPTCNYDLTDTIHKYLHKF